MSHCRAANLSEALENIKWKRSDWLSVSVDLETSNQHFRRDGPVRNAISALRLTPPQLLLVPPQKYSHLLVDTP